MPFDIIVILSRHFECNAKLIIFLQTNRVCPLVHCKTHYNRGNVCVQMYVYGLNYITFIRLYRTSRA